jgi:hypothetical protein
MKNRFRQLNFQIVRSTKLIFASVFGGLLIAAPAIAHPCASDTTMKPESTESNQVVPPIESDEATATVTPESGKVNVLLKNTTNVDIEYQAVGYTELQVLEAGEEHVLRELPVPVTIRSTRQDDGFLKVLPLASEDGMLEVTLDEDKDYYDDLNIGVITIQEDGQVMVH